ncbi:hypothetical protein O3P69_019160 [Scylla paramamosain]|uniref:Uncharacterized protein n=1 Tax=Scylla paramamosain TaxID=85552 RepID=A0AAW0SVN2_SCYPA
MEVCLLLLLLLPTVFCESQTCLKDEGSLSCNEPVMPPLVRIDFLPSVTPRRVLHYKHECLRASSRVTTTGVVTAAPSWRGYSTSKRRGGQTWLAVDAFRRANLSLPSFNGDVIKFASSLAP